ncbi:MAG: hypothetical protein WCJ31_12500 [Planctomycetia bacterium]
MVRSPIINRFLASRCLPIAVCVAFLGIGGMLGGCSTAGPKGFVGSWEEGRSKLIVRANGLAEGELFAAKAPQAFTWRADGPAILLTCGQIANDAVEYRGTLDDQGRLVVESDRGRCVLVRLKAFAGR